MKSILQNDKDKWSIQKAVAFNLNKIECLYAMIGLVFLAGLPYINQSFGDYVDNKPGVVKAPIVYTVKDIAEGTIVTNDEIEVREIAKRRIPSDALISIDAAAGHKCKYGLSAGEIVSSHDIK